MTWSDEANDYVEDGEALAEEVWDDMDLRCDETGQLLCGVCTQGIEDIMGELITITEDSHERGMPFDLVHTLSISRSFGLVSATAATVS